MDIKNTQNSMKDTKIKPKQLKNSATNNVKTQTNKNKTAMIVYFDNAFYVLIPPGALDVNKCQ